MNNTNNTITVNNESWEPAFKKFLRQVEVTPFEVNLTAKGETTIQQTPRNLLRRQGLDALKEDLQVLYGDQFDIVETASGLTIVAENQPGDWTFSWELKSTIKSIDYDPFLEASQFDDDRAAKAEAKSRKASAAAEAERQKREKRERRLRELEDRTRE